MHHRALASAFLTPAIVSGVDRSRALPTAETTAEAAKRFRSSPRAMIHAALCSQRGNVEQTSGLRIAGADAAAEVRGARRQQSSLRPVRAAGAEIEHGSSFRSREDASRLGRDHRLQSHRCNQKRFDDLRLFQWRRDAQQRLVLKDDRAFRDRPDVARELEMRQMLEPIARYVREGGMGTKIFELLWRERKVLQLMQRLLEPGRHEIISARRQSPHPEFKRRHLRRQAVSKISGRHGQFVEIGQQAKPTIIGEQRLCHLSNS